jgi:hypothetical protein
MLRPEQIKSIDEQLKRLEGLNVAPEQQKAVRERWEKLKSEPVPDGPVRLWKHRNFRIPTGYFILPVLTPKVQRTKREEVAWACRVGLYCTKRALEQANAYEQREAALRGIRIWTEMLERNKEPEGEVEP